MSPTPPPPPPALHYTTVVTVCAETEMTGTDALFLIRS